MSEDPILRIMRTGSIVGALPSRRNIIQYVLKLHM